MTHTHTRRAFPRGYVPSISIAIPEPGRLTFGIVWLLLLTLAILYGYFVNQTVVNIVDRTDTELAIENTRSNIGNLEAEFLREKNAITIEYAQSLGFIEFDEAKYVSKKPSENLLTFNERI